MATKITFTPVTPNGITTDYTEAETAQATLDAENATIEEQTKGYKRKREFEYPNWQDQMDDIYHNGIDSWKATIKVIKDKYPKP